MDELKMEPKLSVIYRSICKGSYFLSTRRWQFNQGLQGAINSCFKFVSCARLTFLAKFRTGLTCWANLNETVDKEDWNYHYGYLSLIRFFFEIKFLMAIIEKKYICIVSMMENNKLRKSNNIKMRRRKIYVFLYYLIYKRSIKIFEIKFWEIEII